MTGETQDSSAQRPQPVADLRRGQCLCGAVAFTARPSDEVMACHCTQCQRWTGGGPLYAVAVSELTIDDQTAIAAYRHSDHGERDFCSRCGSTLWWRMQGRPVAYVAPGLFDDQSGLTLTTEIFTDTRAPWQQAIPGAAQSTSAQELAKLEAFLAKETS